MGCSKPLPLDTQAEGHRELALESKSSGGTGDGWIALRPGRFEADFMSIPSPSYTRSELKDTWQSFPPGTENEDDRSAGPIDLNRSTDSYTDANLVNLKYHTSTFPREPELSFPRVNMKDNCRGIDGNNTIAADCLENTYISSADNHNSEIAMNFMPVPEHIKGGNPMNTHAAFGETSGMISKFSSMGNCTSLMSAKEIKDDVNPAPFQYCPIKFDGSPPTLRIRGATEIRSSSKLGQEIVSKLPTPGIINDTGIRSNYFFSSQELASKLEIRPNNKFSTREIASKLKEIDPPQFAARILKESTDITQSIVKASMSRTDAVELLNPSRSLTGMVSHSEVGFTRGQGSISLPNLRSPLATVQTTFPAKKLTPPSPFECLPIAHPQCFTSSGLVSGPIKSGYSASDNDCFLLDQPSSLPGEGMLVSHLEYENLSAMSSQPTKATYIASQSTSNWPQEYLKKSSVTGYSINPHCDQNVGTSINLLQLGNFNPLIKDTTTKVDMTGPSPNSVQTTGHLYSYPNVSTAGATYDNSFPMRIGSQSSRCGTSQSDAGASFPKRIGLHPIYSGPRIAEGNLQKNQAGGLVDYHVGPVRHPFPIGPPPSHLAAQYNSFSPLVIPGPLPVHLAAPVDPFRLSFPSGQQHHGMPTQFSANPPQADHANGLGVPVANLRHTPQASTVVRHSSLKRKASETFPTVRLGQRRKTAPQLIRHHPLLHHRPGIPASIPAIAQIPAAPLHIKWKGFDEPPKPTGQKCLLCKRDLSFTAEGPVLQPTAPETVAILPCGHTFHDRCLQTITPEDDVKNPPCIPCAIGET